MLKKGEDLIKDFDVADSEQLIALWQVCFGDERVFIERFFDEFKDRMKVGIHSEDGRIVSALYCLPAQFKYGGKTLEAEYIYAVATLPEYRGRGFAGGLINELKASDDGASVLFLTPSNEKNKKFYEKLGFRDRLFSYSFEFEKTGEKSDVELRKSENENIFAIRENMLSGCSHVSWDENHLNFAFSKNVFFAYKNDRTVGYFHYDKIKENYAIDEICVLKDCLGDVLEKACETFGEKKVKVSAQYGENCCKISKGMIYCRFDRMDKDFFENQFYLGVNLE